MTNADFYKNMLYFDGTIYHYLTENEAVNAYMTVLGGEAVPEGYTSIAPGLTPAMFDYCAPHHFTEIKTVTNLLDNRRQGNDISKADRKVEKVVRDGKVAVIISPFYGSGFTTGMSRDDFKEKALFDPMIVECLEEGESLWPCSRHLRNLGKYIDSTYGTTFVEASELRVEWVPVGSKFYISEYDGLETLCLLEDLKHYTA